MRVTIYITKISTFAKFYNYLCHLSLLYIYLVINVSYIDYYSSLGLSIFNLEFFPFNGEQCSIPNVYSILPVAVIV